MAKAIFGNRASILVTRQDRDGIRKFYCDVLGGEITKADPERDFMHLGDDFYIAFLYGKTPDDSEPFRRFRAIWLEIKSENVQEMTRKIFDFGVTKLDMP
ncbi:MAG: VOC family protein [Sulfuricaulis sp.]